MGKEGGRENEGNKVEQNQKEGREFVVPSERAISAMQKEVRRGGLHAPRIMKEKFTNSNSN